MPYKDAQRRKEWRKQWYQKNKAVVNTRKTQWNAANPDRVKEIRQRTKDKRRDYNNTYNRRYRAIKKEIQPLEHYIYQIGKRYGLSKREYMKMLNAQQERCAICRQKSHRRLAVDHCHTTGKIRGLLCLKCNSLLGYAKDNIETLMSAREYLINHA